jgi:hypothetical protein
MSLNLTITPSWLIFDGLIGNDAHGDSVTSYEKTINGGDRVQIDFFILDDVLS